MTKFWTNFRSRDLLRSLTLFTLCFALPALADLRQNAERAAGLANQGPSPDALDMALEEAVRGNSQKLQRLTVQRVLNDKAAQTMRTGAQNARSVEPNAGLTPRAAATLAPAYAAPTNVPTPNLRSGQVVSIDELVRAAAPAPAVSGITFPGRVIEREITVSAGQSAVPAETGELDALISETAPTLVPTEPPRPTFQMPSFNPEFNAEEMRTLVGDLAGVPTDNSPRPETQARRNAANRLVANVGNQNSGRENRGAVTGSSESFRPTFYSRALPPQALTNYMERNRIARGSFENARASDGAAYATQTQTYRRPSSSIDGIPHDVGLRVASQGARSTEEREAPSNPNSGFPQNLGRNPGGFGSATAPTAPGLTPSSDFFK